MALPAGAQPMRRATIWDLKVGAPIAEQPNPSEFRGFACGSNGGPPRAPLAGWADFKRCAREAGGLREVYFEYDDELEYIARAHDNDREISRWAGTHEVTFPVITSALFDDAGILKGIRMVTDARPEHKNDIAEGESPVGALFVKRVCERNDPAAGRRIVIRVNLFRKPGQSGYNPQLPTQLTQGQFESSARA